MKNVKIKDFSKITINNFRDTDMLQMFKKELHVLKEFTKNDIKYYILSTPDGFTIKMEANNVEILKTKKTTKKNK